MKGDGFSVTTFSGMTLNDGLEKSADGFFSIW
jgi:hypothetical protein